MARERRSARSVRMGGPTNRIRVGSSAVLAAASLKTRFNERSVAGAVGKQRAQGEQSDGKMGPVRSRPGGMFGLEDEVRQPQGELHDQE